MWEELEWIPASAIVVLTWNTSTWVVDTGGSRAQGCPLLHADLRASLNLVHETHVSSAPPPSTPELKVSGLRPLWRGVPDDLSFTVKTIGKHTSTLLFVTTANLQ